MITYNSKISKKSNDRSTTSLGANSLFAEEVVLIVKLSNFLTMKKLKSFTVKNMSALSREEMMYINGGSNDRYYTSCTLKNAGEMCIYEGRTGTCDYTITTSSSGEVLYYDTFCKV